MKQIEVAAAIIHDNQGRIFATQGEHDVHLPERRGHQSARHAVVDEDQGCYRAVHRRGRLQARVRSQARIHALGQGATPNPEHAVLFHPVLPHRTSAWRCQQHDPGGAFHANLHPRRLPQVRHHRLRHSTPVTTVLTL